jgi:hypothetical protein
MGNVKLKKMEASDMMDVIHFIFEEDSHYTSEESAKSRSNVRVVLYRDMYLTKYKYEYKDPSKKKSNSDYSYDFEPDPNLGMLSDEESAKPFNPKEMQPEVIPYTPVTSFDPTADNPFGGVLDGPMGL